MIVHNDAAPDGNLILNGFGNGSCTNAKPNNIRRDPASIGQYRNIFSIFLFHMVDGRSKFQMNALRLYTLFNFSRNFRVGSQRENMLGKIQKPGLDPILVKDFHNLDSRHGCTDHNRVLHILLF